MKTVLVFLSGVWVALMSVGLYVHFQPADNWGEMWLPTILLLVSWIVHLIVEYDF